MSCRTAALVVALFIAPSAAADGPVRLEQVLSREHPLFTAGDRLAGGRDGRVYLPANAPDAGYVVGVGRDGTDKRGGRVVYAIQGVVATANGHFAHAVTVYGPDLVRRGGTDDFRVGDDVGWDAPATVEAGAESGDFYAVDQHRNRVVRVAPDGRRGGLGPHRRVPRLRADRTVRLAHRPERTPGRRPSGPDGLDGEGRRGVRRRHGRPGARAERGRGRAAVGRRHDAADRR